MVGLEILALAIGVCHVIRQGALSNDGANPTEGKRFLKQQIKELLIQLNKI